MKHPAILNALEIFALLVAGAIVVAVATAVIGAFAILRPAAMAFAWASDRTRKRFDEMMGL